MPTINQLPAIDVISSGDQLPVYAPNLGDVRRMSISTLAQYIEDNVIVPNNAANVTYDPAGGGAVSRSVQAKLRDVVSVKDFGAVGDGVTDDTAAFTAMFATGFPWRVPYTAGGYLVNGVLEPKASGECDGFLLADTGYAGLVVNITGLGYQPNIKITGLDVRCKSARTAGSIGIRVNSPQVTLDRCKATAFDYGIQIWSYSVMLLNCNANMCKTNLSAYAPSSVSEINDIKVIGGSYDSATEYSCRIGDPRFSTTVPPGELMGTTVTLIGAAFDAATSTFDRIYGLNIFGCYWEGPANSKAIELGGAGDGWMRVVNITGCYFANVSYPIYCNSAIRGLNVGPNYYGGTTKSNLYMGNANLYGFSYQSGVATNPTLGAEVHTGYTSVAVGDLKFSGMTIGPDYLVSGSQVAISTADTNNWYPYGKTTKGDINVASSAGRFKITPAFGITGVFSGTSFTCSTLTDSYYFNGGDRITSSAGGFTYVRSVNYDSGVLVLDGGTTAAGGGSISQSAAVFNGSTWAVTLTPATSGSITVHPSFDSGFYTRVGNLVHVQGQIQVQAVSSPVGATVRMSLPFAISNQPELSGRFGGVLNYNDASATFFAEEGDSFIYVQINAASVAAPQNFYFSFSYVAAA